MAGLYGAAWQKASNAYKRAQPHCVDCKARGIRTPVAVVDHIVPHKNDPRLFWDQRNWQSLCKRCHDTKTARQDGGFGHAQSTRPLPGGGPDGMPTGRGHPWSAQRSRGGG